MKRLKQISLFLSCFILLLHAIIPHHHHIDKLVCFSQLEYNDCEEHNACCNSGTHSDNHDFDKGSCIIDDYFTPKDNQNVDSAKEIETNSLECDFFWASLTAVHNKTEVDVEWYDKTIIDKSLILIADIGLRAPPTC